MEQEQLYTITCTKEQLQLIADAVEDWTRFFCGQCELWNGTVGLDNGPDIRTKLEELHSLVVPELPRGASYGWSGGGCPNDYQRKSIAMGYGIYRQIRHFMSLQRKDDSWDCYKSPTLTCKEQGPLIQIDKKEEA